ncbi:hypothetical protein MCAP1_000670 [Malassezia caprae]|uniref:Mediator of RNA polymerase II transcription subunit 7 n=1 Tax=Malassezia caprae TaxID=1381934 RepID=A0AAF0E9B2_9BASI|nr:hypothetical protein MCAP1_000670 [Malassezia caprae]
MTDDAAGAGAALDAAEAPDTLGHTSVFPPPPSVYRHFTEKNLAWLALLQEAKAGHAPTNEADAAERLRTQTEILAQAIGEGSVLVPPDLDLEMELTPPNIAWIEEDGGFQLFGQRWPIPETSPSLAQLGLPDLCGVDGTEPRDRREVLQTLLLTLLQTYWELTGDLLRPVQPYDVWVPAPESANAPEQGTWQPSSHIRDRLNHMETTVINFQYLVNQMRPAHTREALRQLLAAQVERRRAAAAQLRAQCAATRSELERLTM